jgi:hypothetical protein
VHIDLVDQRRVYALVFLEHGTRRLHITGATAHPTGPWAVQQARNLTAELGVRLDSLHFLTRDRDATYTASFNAVFKAENMEAIKTPPRAPRANAHCERAIGTLRREVLAQEHPVPEADLTAHRLLRTRVLGGVINEYRYAI